MRISRTTRCAVLTVAMIVLMTGVGMSGQQGSPFGENQGANITVATISLERAEEIALEHVQGGTVVSSEYRFDHGRDGYAVLVINGDARVKLKIDASTGQVVSMERKRIEPVEHHGNRWAQGTVSQGGIDIARAREIALAKTGGGTVVKVDREFKRGGQIVFEIDIVGSDRKYEIELDGHSGAVIEYQEKMLRHGKKVRYHD